MRRGREGRRVDEKGREGRMVDEEGEGRERREEGR